MENGGIASFLGVPYGASTAGANRFRAPQLAPRWKGVRDALAFGAAAPQTDIRASASGNFSKLLNLLAPRAGSLVESSEMDEDCLRLNIWAPSDAQDRSLPVLVWVHGGGYTYGSGNGVSVNSGVLAAAGDVVVVTVTHRLGLLGFLDLREFGEGGSANAGLLDIVAALEWIQKNIAVFGGDASRVTVCGQSGGGGKVAALNAMPRARDLFARTIMMSAPFGRSYTEADASALRHRVMSASGFTSVDELRAASTERLLDLQEKVLKDLASEPRAGARALELDTVPGFGPSLDAVDLPCHSVDGAATEGFRGKQLMIGWTSHEVSSLLTPDSTFTAEMSSEDAAVRVNALSDIDGITYDDVAQQFSHEPPHLVLARRLSDLIYAGPSRRLAELVRAQADGVWVYEFRQSTEVLGGLLGSTHSLDIAYVFGTVDRIPLSGRSLQRHSVSREMMHAWASFAHHGDPGWEQWDEDRTVKTFGLPFGTEQLEHIDLSTPLRTTRQQTPALS